MSHHEVILQGRVEAFRWTDCDTREGQVSHRVGGDGGGHWRVGPVREGGLDQVSSTAKPKGDYQQPTGLGCLRLAGGNVVETMDGGGLKVLFKLVHLRQGEFSKDHMQSYLIARSPLQARVGN